MNQFFYLHGFASSPDSTKARYLSDCFQSRQIPLQVPDLNQEDFYHLSLSRQIQQVEALFSPGAPVTLIGSSFGGLTAAWLGQRCAEVEQLVLLAPAFQFWLYWRSRLGEEVLQRWQTEGSIPVYHYGARQMLPLGYPFVTDLVHYQEALLTRPVPTLILHGQQDEVIPIQASQEFAATRSWVKLIELESDHALTEVQPEIWQAIQEFCGL